MEQVFIPLSQLSAWEGNVRTTHHTDDMEALAASIAANGLLQPLVVRQAGDAQYQVVAGRRRFQALLYLVESGVRDGQQAVPCTVVDPEVNFLEVSLAENVTQLPMHPADRFTAFRALADKGMAVPEIAARFGISEPNVYKLLRLGNVSPGVMDAYREGKLNYEQVQAFTISDNHAEQDRLLPCVLDTPWRFLPRHIRAELAKDELPATDKQVQFVGLEFYELCGGLVRRDLFDDSNSGYVQDRALLASLVENKAQSQIDQIKAEGWGWVEFRPDRDWGYWNGFTRLLPVEREFTPEEQEAYIQMEALLEAYEEEEVDEEEDETTAAVINALYTRLADLKQATIVWPPETKAASGVLVYLKPNGELQRDNGMVERGANEPDVPATAPATPKKDASAFSDALLQDLSRHRTAALRAELADNPRVALVAVVHALVSCMAYQGKQGDCLTIRFAETHLFGSEAAEGIPAMQAMQAKLRHLGLPDNPAQLWDWLMGRDTDDLHAILAVCAALSLDAVMGALDPGQRNMRHSHQLAKSLDLDMRKWFTPTAGNLFSRMGKAQILEAYREATGTAPSKTLREMKKKDLAVRAEREIGERWLPPMFRLREDTVAAETAENEPFTAQ